MLSLRCCGHSPPEDITKITLNQWSRFYTSSIANNSAQRWIPDIFAPIQPQIWRGYRISPIVGIPHWSLYYAGNPWRCSISISMASCWSVIMVDVGLSNMQRWNRVNKHTNVSVVSSSSKASLSKKTEDDFYSRKWCKGHCKLIRFISDIK